MEPAFSRRGEAATAFERTLIEQHLASLPVEQRDSWMLLLQRVGLDVLLVVLDEIGGERQWVPTREYLTQRIWRAELDKRIAHLSEVEGLSWSEVAARVGSSRWTVKRSLQRGAARPVGAPGQRGPTRG